MIAKANALQKIMGQDGYVKGEGPLKTLMRKLNEEVIRELLELLKKNAMKEQANDVFEICSYVDGLEKKD